VQTVSDQALVPSGRNKEIQVARKAEVVEDIAHCYGVALDVPVKRVAEIAVRHKLTDLQVDDLMLARQQYEARFSVVDHLLASGYSSDNIFTAFQIVDGFYNSPEPWNHEVEEAKPRDAIIEEPKSLFELAQAQETPNDSPKDSTGASLDELITSLSDKFVVMILEWIESLDVFRDVTDADEISSMLEVIAITAVEAGYTPPKTVLEVLTLTLVKLRSAKGFDNSFDSVQTVIKASTMKEKS
jgi:hypothetical protein